MISIARNKLIIITVLFSFCFSSMPVGLYAAAGRNDNLRPKSNGQTDTKDGGENAALHGLKISLREEGGFKEESGFNSFSSLDGGKLRLQSTVANAQEGTALRELIAYIDRSELIRQLFTGKLTWYDSVKGAWIDNKSRLDWIDILDRVEPENLKDVVKSTDNDGFEFAVNLGIGGSGNGAIAEKGIFSSYPRVKNFFVLGSVEPEAIRNLENSIDITKTVFLVISKSWTTVEIEMLRLYFYSRLYDYYKSLLPDADDEIWRERTGRHFVVISDPGKADKDAATYKFRQLIEHAKNVGGRYASYFDVVGLLPAAYMGIIDKIVSSGKRGMEICRNEKILDEKGNILNYGAYLGAYLTLQESLGKNIVIILPAKYKALYTWLGQIFVESTCKKNEKGESRGLFTVLADDELNPAKYDKNRNAFLYIHDQNSVELNGKVAVLEESGYSVLHAQMGSENDLGEIISALNVGIAIEGWLSGVNFADEPGVWVSKDLVLKVFIPLLNKWQLAGKSKDDFLKYVGRLTSSSKVIKGRKITLDYGYLLKDKAVKEAIRKEINSLGGNDNDISVVLAAIFKVAAGSKENMDLLVYQDINKYGAVLRTFDSIVRGVLKANPGTYEEPGAQHWLHQGLQDGRGKNMLFFVGIKDYEKRDVQINGSSLTFGELTGLQRAANFCILSGGLPGLVHNDAFQYDLDGLAAAQEFFKSVVKQGVDKESSTQQWGVNIELKDLGTDTIAEFEEILSRARDYISAPPASVVKIARTLDPGIKDEVLAENWIKFNDANSRIFIELSGERLKDFILFLINNKLLDTGVRKAVIFSDEDRKLPGFYQTLAALRGLEAVKIAEGVNKGKSALTVAVYGRNAEAVKVLADNDDLVAAGNLPALKKILAEQGITVDNMVAVVAEAGELSETHFGMQKIISGRVFTLAAGEALKALFARGEYKQGVDDAFGAFWNALVERKIVPVTPEKVESTYREMVTKPIDKIEALNLAELPIMEESKRSEITKSQVEINTITSKLTGMGV